MTLLTHPTMIPTGEPSLPSLKGSCDPGMLVTKVLVMVGASDGVVIFSVTTVRIDT